MAAYNNHFWKITFSIILLFLAFIFLFALFGYQSGTPGFLFLGSVLTQSGSSGEIVAELIILLLFFIGTYILVYFLTLQRASKALLSIYDYKAIETINPGSEKYFPPNYKKNVSNLKNSNNLVNLNTIPLVSNPQNVSTSQNKTNQNPKISYDIEENPKNKKIIKRTIKIIEPDNTDYDNEEIVIDEVNKTIETIETNQKNQIKKINDLNYQLNQIDNLQNQMKQNLKNISNEIY